MVKCRIQKQADATKKLLLKKVRQNDKLILENRRLRGLLNEIKNIHAQNYIGCSKGSCGVNCEGAVEFSKKCESALTFLAYRDLKKSLEKIKEMTCAE